MVSLKYIEPHFKDKAVSEDYLYIELLFDLFYTNNLDNTALILLHG